MKILITGSSGLIGGEAVEYFDKQGHDVIGVDNNMRREFFGDAGDTSWNLHRIYHKSLNFQHENVDIRDRMSLQKHVFDKHGPFDVVIHCAAQPSHDKSRDIPLVDFEVNALGTMNMLELTRQNSPQAVFIFTSTNKVYGDNPNLIPVEEKETRYDYVNGFVSDVNESMSLDQNTHSIFGASKVAADVMVQEYGRYFGMKTCVFRGGCLTGPNHSGVELHGFLSYLVKCGVNNIPYKIFGYKGKQVRDNIHSYDVIRAMECVINKPCIGGVYNMGGGRDNSISILEAIAFIEKFIGKKMQVEILDTPRVGDHICYISNMLRFQTDYPQWKITKSIERILIELLGKAQSGMATERYVPGDGEDERFEAYAGAIVKECKGRVLDIGAGNAYLSRRIMANGKATEVTATDKMHYEPSGWVKKMFYWTIPTEDLIKINNIGQFHTICSTEHIEHLGWRIHDPLLHWIATRLYDDGVFVGSMPTPDDPNNPNPYHLKTYTLDEWTHKLSNYFSSVYIVEIRDDCYYWVAKGPRR